ncbi:MAG: polysaccharide biosynthesis protein [Anaerolineae bacterium]|nr:polysaccharide biosynthesis protein [Anaerolineae bacterium]
MSVYNGRLALRNRHYVVIDLVCFVFAAAASFAIRFERVDAFTVEQGAALFLLLVVLIKPLVFFSWGMYQRYWFDAGASELILSASASVLSGLLLTALVFAGTMILREPELSIPRSIPIIDTLVTLTLVVGNRFSVRAYNHMILRRRSTRPSAASRAKRALIIGAGMSGTQVLNALGHEPGRLTAVGFLDDDPAKEGTLVRGVRVLGKLSDIQRTVREYEVKVVVIAMPSAPGAVIRRLMHDCQEMRIEYHIMPGVFNVLSGNSPATIGELRRVSLADLLRRQPICLDTSDIHAKLAGRCVLITGAGGSIGSELVRQIMGYGPARLLLVGHGENSLFALESQLKEEKCAVPYHLLLADVRDAKRMERIFEQWRPQFIFHAAAHKHVPMLENNLVEAVSNNVISTSVLISLCERYDAERMVLISTDKAVKPTNVMGMSKRAAELLMLSASAHKPGRYAVVRFGNVLGSRGSVVPTFERQIAVGGPITVTSEKMTRFFMSIPEATQLVLKAAALNGIGTLFVLNMGEPVPIIEMAKDLVRLSGLVPYEDVDIKVTGLRPGEKLYEELFWDDEHHVPVEQGAIFVVKNGDHVNGRGAALSAEIEALIGAARSYDEDGVRTRLERIVFTGTTHERSNGHHSVQTIG